MVRTLFIFSLFLSSLTVFSQKLKTVEGEYTYHAPENVTMEQAKQTALQRAMIKALADEFGTIVSQMNTTQISSGGESSMDFNSISESEVKGEWIETIGEPVFKISYNGGMLVVDVTVKGKAREIVSASAEFKTLVLCNGTEDKFQSTSFKSEDQLYLSFQSPAKGYVAVYLVDDERQAFCLLPYANQQEGAYPVEANRRYVFFHPQSAPHQERQIVDEYVMTCAKPTEHNQVYVFFSPNQFFKAVDSQTGNGLPRQLSFKDFQKWQTKCRKRDKDMGVNMISITIQE